MADVDQSFLESPPPALVAKWQAQAEQARAAAGKLQAERRVALREEEKGGLEVERGKLIVEMETLAAEDGKDARDRRLADDDYPRRFYHFHGEVNPSSVSGCMTKLKQWHRLDPDCDIEVMFSSPGGSVIAGIELYDFISSLRKYSGGSHKITTSSYGWAASMAGILLQAGDVRKIGPESWLMIHESSFMAAGKLGDVEDTVEWIKSVSKRVVNIFVNRAQELKDDESLRLGKPRRVISKRAFESAWRRKDWFVSADQAWTLGLVDVIG